ncbi:hypothetical protein CfE428DRAFT_5138 [Chthoniobacter flavus Ellin428]|uniref:Uncharacterized protein n=2 Tax=Chthoniobacter flavus TaxID=191863 RepID=B4D898_9BACT|nr:hypothetical protein CfE428DRAFT_5138 [Chthoniobacter flavus Ellin428]TCO90137.1 hypothetical protein EV701_11161 [Chthoniobacter flavus]
MYLHGASLPTMKKVLSLLVAFVFLQVQSWALSGGPVFLHNGNPSIIGTYGGVLIPQSSTSTPATLQPASIGIFSMSVPETGISAGVAIVFVNGVAFIGQIAGIGDGDKGTIQGLIAGESNFTVTIGTQQFNINAQGSFKAKVIQGSSGAFTPAPAGSGNGAASSSSSSTPSTSSEVGSTNSARLTGTAEIGTFFRVNTITGEPLIDVVVTYAIDGIKQNNVPANVTTVPFNFTGGGSGS